MRLIALLFAVSGLVFYLYTLRPPPDRIEHPPTLEVRAEGEAREATAVLYFARSDGLGLVAEKRRFRLRPGVSLLERAIAELARGPEIAGAERLWPERLPPPKVYLGGRRVYLDLDEAYARLALDVRGESLLLYGLANTALANSEANEVQFLVGGEVRPVLVHLSLLEPFRRGGR